MDYTKLVDTIKNTYNSPTCELHFNSDYQLIVAVILSAQCTDKRVNLTTPELFKKYPSFEALAKADITEVEKLIKPCGFYHNKAKNLINMAKDVTEKYNQKLPSDKQKLVELAGVGEKTANVVLATWFNIPAIAVDTHVFRVSNRLGLAHAKDVKTTQKQLEKRLDKSDWIDMHYSLVLHGRYVCKAINPNCKDCVLQSYCKFYKTKNNK